MKKWLSFVLAALLALSAPALAAGEASPSPSPEPPAPVVSALADPQPQCKAAVLLYADSGEVFYDFHGSDHNFPASITKVMTALLTLEAVDRGELSLEQVVTCSDTFQFDLSDDGSTQNIKPGEELTVHELLYCALVASANEACNILAETVAGSAAAFIQRMNERAAQLGMENTHFANCHGLHQANHYTSARDLGKLVQTALQNETFQAIVSSKSHTTPATNLTDDRTYINTNALLTGARYPGYTYPNAIGVKTGSTPEAGQCLASAAIKDGRTIICIVLGAENLPNEDGTVTRNSFVESRRLLEWGFENFSRRTLLDGVTPVKEIPVTLSADTTAVALKPQERLEAILPNDMDPAGFQRVITTYQEELEAPIQAGQELGEITVRNGDTVYGTVKLVAAASAERSELLYRLHQVKLFFQNIWVRVGLVALAVLVVLLLLRRSVVRRRSRRRGYTGRKRRR